MSMSETPLLAAIRVTKGFSVDDILAAVARALSAEGLAVTGFIQHDRPGDDECCGQILLEDLSTGDMHVISQPLGAAARGCRLDPQALAAIAGPLQARIEAEPDFLILNRFGKGESEGQGFRAAIEGACARGVPMLTAVREAYVDAWQEFAGDLGVLMPPDADRVIDWARRAAAVGARTAEPAEAVCRAVPNDPAPNRRAHTSSCAASRHIPVTKFGECIPAVNDCSIVRS